MMFGHQIWSSTLNNCGKIQARVILLWNFRRLRSRCFENLFEKLFWWLGSSKLKRFFWENEWVLLSSFTVHKLVATFTLKCYINFLQYSSKEEAVVARGSLHNLVWPVGNPKELKVDFIDEAGVSIKLLFYNLS